MFRPFLTDTICRPEVSDAAGTGGVPWIMFLASRPGCCHVGNTPFVERSLSLSVAVIVCFVPVGSKLEFDPLAFIEFPEAEAPTEVSWDMTRSVNRVVGVLCKCRKG